MNHEWEKVAADVAYISAMALVWLYARQVPLALLPFTVYSVFHVATYTRSYLLPTFQPAKADTSSSPGSPKAAAAKTPLGDAIGRFIKRYYDASMGLVATLEILLVFRLVLSALTFSKGSWVLLLIYLAFFRARFSQSQFVQQAIRHFTARIDTLVAHQSTPPQVRQGWETAKGYINKAYQNSETGRYQPKSASKKPQ